MLYKTAVAAAVVFAMPFALQAAMIVQPVSTPDFSSENAAPRPANATRDGSGLSFSLSTGDAIPGSYPDHDTTATGMWATVSGDPAPFITYDLGAEFNLTGFHVWNFNQSGFTDVGARSVSVTFSTTSAVAGFGSPELFAGLSEFAIAPASSTYACEDKLFGAPHIARWVRFDILTNHGNASFNGLSEVRFFEEPVVAAPAVPEPATLALLALGGVCLVLRSRRRKLRELGNANGWL